MPRPTAPRPARRATRWLAGVATALTVGTAGLVVSAVPAAAAPAFPAPNVHLPSGIESVTYVGQESCDPSPKKGVRDFAAILRDQYGYPTYINRVCQQGGMSEHKDGRAIDWMVGKGNDATAHPLIAWLRAKDSAGHANAMAKRLGVMYLIWNDYFMPFYGNTAGQWEDYNGCSEKASLAGKGYDTYCHRDHVHLSFTWAGAYGRTSYWTGRVAATDYGPCRPDGLSWAPQYTAANPSRCSWASNPPAMPSSPSWLRSLSEWSGIRLSTGWDSPAVVPVQQALGVSPANGKFDASTKSALVAFQRSHGLSATGVTDVPTWRALLRARPSAATAPASTDKTYAAPALLEDAVFLRSSAGATSRHTLSGTRVTDSGENLGGVTPSAPAAAAYGSQTVVAVRGTNNATYVKFGKPGSWGAWRAIGGRTHFAPAVATDSAGTLHVFVTGTDRALWTKTYDGRWSGWQKVGGLLIDGPAAAQVASHLDVAVTGLDHAIYLNRLTGSSWTGFRSQGGRTNSAPAVGYDAASGTEVIVVRGTNNRVYYRTSAGSWHSLGGRTYDAPSVSDRSAGLTIAVRGTDNRVWTGTGPASWSGWALG